MNPGFVFASGFAWGIVFVFVMIWFAPSKKDK